MHLQDLTERAKRAYNNLSHNPERRGETLIKEFEAELEEDIEFLTRFREGFDKESYIAKFHDHVSVYIARLSNCASAFITGSGNFPVERNRKAHESADRALNKMNEWRAKVAKPPKAPKPVNENAKPDKVFEFEGFKVVVSGRENRIKIIYDSKPDSDTIATLKKAAFKYSPTNQCWQRILTDNAIAATMRVLGLTRADFGLK